MNNEIIINKWLESNFNSSYERKDKNISFSNNKLYSYNTCIACILTPNYPVKNDNKNDVLLVSYDTMSHTTSRHLLTLIRQNKKYKVIRVPFRYGSYNFSILELYKEFESLLNFHKKYLTQKKHRLEYICLYNNALMFLNAFLSNEVTNKFINEYSRIYNLITNYHYSNDRCYLKLLKAA